MIYYNADFFFYYFFIFYKRLYTELKLNTFFKMFISALPHYNMCLFYWKVF